MSPSYECIIVEREGPFATITMNRPDQRNALSLAHLRELLDAFTTLARTDARGVILAGNGPVFHSSQAELSHMRSSGFCEGLRGGQTKNPGLSAGAPRREGRGS